MEELRVKKDFTDIYKQKVPNNYLKEMQKLEYRIPDKTKPLYLSLAKQLYNKLSRTINILDIGSSYGINSALMKYDLKMSELDDFFLKEDTPTKKQTREFFEDQPIDKTLSFCQIDISQPALDFSKDVQLCKKIFCINLEKDVLPINEVPPLDMIIATGCIGYIGYKAFSSLLESIKKQDSDYSKSLSQTNPIFAFSVLRIFDMEKIQKTFEDYGYSIVKSNLKPIRQRRFSDPEEKHKTVSLLHGKGIDTKKFEDHGYFYADFYVASPKKIEPQLTIMLQKMERCASC
ncbi:MAG: hypothetical protein COW27_02515 [Nitrosopumilales archaeon CG15_BIG_FIL_POST_REV_8_21_14_020_37_12]|nr:MAG: hypothetical protein COW27_02515 [Nitrosopumilales archaeon CG15_BIG_FIL_POST_REV_8_21_14_020_37_12]